MKIYLAGPISGVKEYWKPFEAAEDELTAQGNVVLNPATLPEGLDYDDYIHIDRGMIDRVDVVVLLAGWENSNGARDEREYALSIGKRVVEYEKAGGK